MQKVAAFFRSQTSKLAFIVLAGATILTPFLVLPLTENFLLDSKMAFVMVVGFVIFLLWAISTFTKKSIQLTISPFFLPLVLFAAVVLVSSFLNSPYPIAQLLGWAGIYLSLVVMVVFGSSLLNQQSSRKFLSLLLIPSLVLAITSFGELMGVGPSRIFSFISGSQIPTTPFFNLAGSPIIAAEFLAIVLFAIVCSALTSKKKRSPFYILSGILVLIGFGISIYSLYQVQKGGLLLLPYGASWSIAVDSLKSVQSALIGYGPNNYAQVYMALKPAFINATDLWTIPFNQGSNFPFTLLSTVGLFGLGAWLFLVIQAIRSWKKRTPESVPAAAVFFGALLIELILPVNILILMIQALALAFWVAAEKNTLRDVQLHAFTVQLIKSGEETQRIPKHTHLMVYLVTLISVVLLGLTGYWITRSILAQYFAFQGGLAAAHSDITHLFSDQQEAIVLNPFSDTYRRNYALTNINIAAMLANSKGQGQPAPDQQKVLALVQQAIQEAKAATQLNPIDSQNWITIARIHANLIGVADQADQWSVAEYSQAMALAPNDPTIHFELGSVLYNLGKFDQAVEIFRQTATLKPNWANAFYALANTYRQRNQLPDAIANYQETLVLLGTSSADYAKVKAELDAVQAQMSAAQTGANANGAGANSAANSAATQTPPVVVKPARTKVSTQSAQPQAADIAPAPASGAASLKNAKDVLQNANLNQ